MLAIIGGSGLTQLANLEATHRKAVRTPYGEPSGAITFGTLRGRKVMFLARHGYGHTIPPHEVNYRANIWALHEEGASGIVSVASVGGIRDDLGPGALVVPAPGHRLHVGTALDVLRGRRRARHARRLHRAVLAAAAHEPVRRGARAAANRSSTARCTRARRVRGSKAPRRSSGSRATAPTWSA